MIHLIALSDLREKLVVREVCLGPRDAVHESGTVSKLVQLADAASWRVKLTFRSSSCSFANEETSSSSDSQLRGGISPFGI